MLLLASNTHSFYAISLQHNKKEDLTYFCAFAKSTATTTMRPTMERRTKKRVQLPHHQGKKQCKKATDKVKGQVRR